MAEAKEAKGTVCVTGAAGFTGSHIVKALLEADFHVHATVRDINKKEKYQHLLELPQAKTHLRIFQADLTQPDSFVIPVQACQYVIHVAAVVMLTAPDPRKTIYEPTMNGTKGLLDACVTAGTIQKFVLTSSASAVNAFPKTGVTFTEQMWNSTSTLDKEPYMFSKVESEKLVWEYVDKLDEDKKFAVTVFNPGYICGPILSKADLNGSTDVFVRFLTGRIPLVPKLHYTFVDVRDVAQAHVMSLLRPETDGQRYLLGNAQDGELWLKQVADILKEFYPKHPLPSSECPNFLVLTGVLFQKEVSFHFMWQSLGQISSFNNDKSRQLGLVYRPIRHTIKDTADSLIALNIVPRQQ